MQVASKFYGILNGVDVEDWNPANDPVLPANFNTNKLEGKALCKEYLQKVCVCMFVFVCMCVCEGMQGANVML